MPSLQEIVDDLADRTGRAIDVEDRRFRLLAHSAHDGPVDAVRRDTILRRAATPEVVARLDALGVAAARGHVRLPPAPALGMSARLCFPVRERDALLGYVWVVDDPPVGDREAAELATALAAVGPALAALRDREDERREAQTAAIIALLAGDTAPAAALLGEHGPVSVAVAHGADDLAALRRLAGAGRALTGEHDGLAVAVLVATAVHEGGAATLGVGGPVPGLDGAADAHRQAVLAFRVALACPAFRPVAHFGALGPHGLLAPLAFPPGGGPPATLPAAIERLRAAADGAELLATVRAVLDAGDDMTGAASRLHVHRSTLHRRLRRVEQLTGAELADGRSRLELHAGLVLAELLGA